MKINEKALTETKEYYIYDTYYALDDENPDKRDMLLKLPKTPDNCGWFKVKLRDGREFTIYDLNAIIEDYMINNPEGTDDDPDNSYEDDNIREEWS